MFVNFSMKYARQALKLQLLNYFKVRTRCKANLLVRKIKVRDIRHLKFNNEILIPLVLKFFNEGRVNLKLSLCCKFIIISPTPEDG